MQQLGSSWRCRGVGSTLAHLSFDDFVLSRGSALVRFALALTGEIPLAEDITQSVLGRAFGRWGRIAGLDRPEAYVKRMIVNEHLSWRRRRASRDLPMAHLPDSGVPDAGQALVDRDATWRLLATLPKRQRAVLVLRFYEGLPDGQIAELLGCAPSTVRSQASRALASLRESLRDPSTTGTSHG